MRIVVVGGVAAGMSAASRARRQNPDAEITVFERGPHISYGACGLPYVLGGVVPDWDDLIARAPEQMRARGIEVKLGHEATSLDAQAQHIQVRNLQTGRLLTQPYDKLLLATGVSAVKPDWAAADLAGLHVLRDIPSGQALADSLEGAKRVCIVGGGYIGLELAENLRHRGLDITLLERGAGVAAKALDRSLQHLVAEELERCGVEVRLQTSVQSLTSKSGRVTGVQTDSGHLQADVVVVAVGVKPNVELFTGAGGRLGRTGAIRVDAQQRTSLPNIYAAGDNCQSVHRVTRRPVHIPLGLSANRMGRVAGVNMAGGEARFPGVVGTAIFKVFNLGVARTGLTQADAEAAGLDAVSLDVSSTDHAGYYPDAQAILVRLTAERGTGRLLGAQIVADEHLSAKRIDVVAALLHKPHHVRDLFELDLAYAPPFSGVWDVLLVAADRLLRLV